MDLDALAAVSKELRLSHAALGATFDHLDNVGSYSTLDKVKVNWARNKVSEAEWRIEVILAEVSAWKLQMEILAEVQAWKPQIVGGSGSLSSRAGLDSKAFRFSSSSTGSRTSSASQSPTQNPEHSSESVLKRRRIERSRSPDKDKGKGTKGADTDQGKGLMGGIKGKDNDKGKKSKGDDKGKVTNGEDNDQGKGNKSVDIDKGKGINVDDNGKGNGTKDAKNSKCTKGADIGNVNHKGKRFAKGAEPRGPPPATP